MRSPQEAETRMHGRILVVDDQEMVRGLLRRAMEQEGYTVLEAEDGEQALEILGRSAVDLVVSDALMPRMDGLELLKRVKRDHPGTRVIILTGHTGEHDVTQFLIAGADEYIAKPFVPRNLLDVIQRLLDSGEIGDAHGS